MENLNKLRDRVLSLPILEGKLNQLENRIAETEATAEKLLGKYRKEQRDVEKIQSESFSSSLLRIFGKYDEKLAKESMEELEAKINYDKLIAQLQNLLKEKAELVSRISAYRSDARLYEDEMKKRRILLQNKLNSDEGLKYQSLLDERQVIISQQSEIKEAISAANRVKGTVCQACSSLKSADGWATFDLWTKGGFLTDLAKYSHVDDAQACFNTLSAQLKSLNSELRDVQNLNIPEFNEISSFDRTVDFWFDNIFTNLSVRDQIRGNLDELERLGESVTHIENILHSKLAALEPDLDNNSRLQENLLIALG